MAVIHISESEAARDFAALLAQVRAGAEVIIEDDMRPAVVLRIVNNPPARLLSESLPIAKGSGSTVTLDGDFASNPAIRLRRETFIGDLLRSLTVYPYTREAAPLAGKIDGEQQSRSVTIPFGDLLIAATALSIGFSVFTVNQRHFRLVPGLHVIAL